MYCQKCGFDNLENAAICQQCGGVFVYSQPTRTSGTAITSMILGISGFSMFGVFGVTWIIGLIFGILALNKISKAGGALKGKGFAITGIITSAIGLSLVLTIFGIWMFFTSAKTISLSRKINMRADFTEIVSADEKPTIEGWVYVTGDKVFSGDCGDALFAPGDANEIVTDTSLTCRLKGQEPINVSWRFAGTKDDADVYNFTIIASVDEDSTTTTKKTIFYDGSKRVIYEADKYKVFIKSPEPQKQD